MASGDQVRLGIVGYGEIGGTWGAGLRANGLRGVASYDKHAFDGAYAGLIQSRAAAAGVTLVRSAAELAGRCDIILGATPGSASIESAEAFAPALGAGQIFVDVASATPAVKQSVARILAPTGARVGDASIMGTPKDGLGMPLIASGEPAETLIDLLNPWGMNFTNVGPELGTASGMKIMRSVLIKGIEGLLYEMILGCRHYGIEEAVVSSAVANLAIPFDVTIDRMLSGGVIHAARRAEEMRMAAEALSDAGVDPVMTRSTAERLQWVADMDLKRHFNGVVPAGYREAVEAIEAARTSARRP